MKDLSDYLQAVFWAAVLLFTASALVAMSIILWKVALS